MWTQLGLTKRLWGLEQSGTGGFEIVVVVTFRKSCPYFLQRKHGLWNLK